MRASRIIWRIVFALFCVVSVWFYAWAYFRRNWGWPLSIVFGAVYLFVLVFVIRRARGKPAPFQLVLRLANDKGGDSDDDATFEKLHKRFKDPFPRRGDVRFDGFDTDGSWTWFYFLGSNDQSVREAVLSQLQDCKIRAGSYFLSGATQMCAPPDDGPTLQL